MELSEVMRTMSGVRRYLREDVADEVIYAALDDARFAPSGGNRQPWRVVVIRNLDLRKKVSEVSSREWRVYTAKWYPSPEEITEDQAKKLKEGTDYHANMHQAPVHLFVWTDLGSLALTDRNLDRVSFVGGGSVYPFVQNLQLALSSRGVGSRITALAIPAEAEWAELMSVPEGYGLAAVMTIGYPEWRATRLSRNPVEELCPKRVFRGTTTHHFSLGGDNRMDVMKEWPADQWPGHSGNWNRWPNDLGTLNLLTSEAILRGAAAVRSGKTLPLSRPLDLEETARRFTTPFVVHEIIKADEGGFEEGDLTQSSADRLSTRVHGMTHTHIDALAHMGYRGRTFNGYYFPDVVTMSEGVKNTEMDITPMAAVATRALFIDIARRRGVDALTPGDSVMPEELEFALDRIEPGDAAVIRIGGTIRVGKAAADKSEHGTWHHGTWAGLDTDCVDVLAARDVSLIATDSPGDTFPHRHEGYCRSPGACLGGGVLRDAPHPQHGSRGLGRRMRRLRPGHLPPGGGSAQPPQGDGVARYNRWRCSDVVGSRLHPDRPRADRTGAGGHLSHS